MSDEKSGAQVVAEKVDECLRPLNLPKPMRDAFAMMLRTFASKNADYSSGSWRSNFDEVGADVGHDGQFACNVLIAVKQARLKALRVNGRAPHNESVLDTYLDRAVYATLSLGLELDDAAVDAT